MKYIFRALVLTALVIFAVAGCDSGGAGDTIKSGADDFVTHDVVQAFTPAPGANVITVALVNGYFREGVKITDFSISPRGHASERSVAYNSLSGARITTISSDNAIALPGTALTTASRPTVVVISGLSPLAEDAIGSNVAALTVTKNALAVQPTAIEIASTVVSDLVLASSIGSIANYDETISDYLGLHTDPDGVVLDSVVRIDLSSSGLSLATDVKTDDFAFLRKGENYGVWEKAASPAKVFVDKSGVLSLSGVRELSGDMYLAIKAPAQIGFITDADDDGLPDGNYEDPSPNDDALDGVVLRRLRVTDEYALTTGTEFKRGFTRNLPPLESTAPHTTWVDISIRAATPIVGTFQPNIEVSDFVFPAGIKASGAVITSKTARSVHIEGITITKTLVNELIEAKSSAWAFQSYGFNETCLEADFDDALDPTKVATGQYRFNGRENMITIELSGGTFKSADDIARLLYNNDQAVAVRKVLPDGTDVYTIGGTGTFGDLDGTVSFDGVLNADTGVWTVPDGDALLGSLGRSAEGVLVSGISPAAGTASLRYISDTKIEIRGLEGNILQGLATLSVTKKAFAARPAGISIAGSYREYIVTAAGISGSDPVPDEEEEEDPDNPVVPLVPGTINRLVINGTASDGDTVGTFAYYLQKGAVTLHYVKGSAVVNLVPAADDLRVSADNGRIYVDNLDIPYDTPVTAVVRSSAQTGYSPLTPARIRAALFAITPPAITVSSSAGDNTLFVTIAGGAFQPMDADPADGIADGYNLIRPADFILNGRPLINRAVTITFTDSSRTGIVVRLPDSLRLSGHDTLVLGSSAFANPSVSIGNITGTVETVFEKYIPADMAVVYKILLDGAAWSDAFLHSAPSTEEEDGGEEEGAPTPANINGITGVTLNADGYLVLGANGLRRNAANPYLRLSADVLDGSKRNRDFKLSLYGAR